MALSGPIHPILLVNWIEGDLKKHEMSRGLFSGKIVHLQLSD